MRQGVASGHPQGRSAAKEPQSGLTRRNPLTFDPTCCGFSHSLFAIYARFCAAVNTRVTILVETLASAGCEPAAYAQRASRLHRSSPKSTDTETYRTHNPPAPRDCLAPPRLKLPPGTDRGAFPKLAERSDPRNWANRLLGIHGRLHLRLGIPLFVLIAGALNRGRKPAQRSLSPVPYFCLRMVE